MAQHQGIRKQTSGSRSSGTGGPPTTATPTDIPDKLYFRIGEVARLCDVPAYVLRFWESEFPQLKPNKGGTGQRLFRRRDVEVALRIKRLLYDEGYTIPGARQLLKGEAKAREPQLSLLADDSARAGDLPARWHALRRDLAALLTMLQSPPGDVASISVDDRRKHDRTTAARRTNLQAVPPPASDKLFDFPGSSPVRTALQETEKDLAP